MSEASIRLSVPGELAYRDVVIRATAAACRLVRDGATQSGSLAPLDLSDNFDAELVSAVSEIFNNIVIHGYNAADGDLGADPSPVFRESASSPIEFEIRLREFSLEVLITDNGPAFDIESVPSPELESLPEGGMGIHIARSCVDALDYTPGPPNCWRLLKSAKRASQRPSTQA